MIPCYKICARRLMYLEKFSDWASHKIQSNKIYFPIINTLELPYCWLWKFHIIFYTHFSSWLRPIRDQDSNNEPIRGRDQDSPTNGRRDQAEFVQRRRFKLLSRLRTYCRDIAGDMDSNGFYKVIISYIVFIYAVRAGKSLSIVLFTHRHTHKQTQMTIPTQRHTQTHTYRQNKDIHRQT